MSSERKGLYFLLPQLMSQLSYEQCVKLEFIKHNYARLSQREIAKQLGTTQSTISRELSRMKSQGGYKADIYKDRQKTRETTNQKIHTIIKPGSELENYILEKINKHWSPEQIAGTRNDLHKTKICHWTIYKYLKEQHPELIKKLRRKGKPYRKSSAGKSKIPNRVSIHERPKEVAEKQRLGDYEGDTILGSNKGDRIVTIVDRKSRYTYAALILQSLNSRLSMETSFSIIGMLKNSKNLETLTLDNGSEFADHEYISQMLGIDIYFADPYSSRQRGCNEYHNGLLREFIPKGTDLRTITQEQLAERVHLINTRPRKSLNYKTPAEVYFG